MYIFISVVFILLLLLLFRRLLAAFTSLEKVVNYNRKVTVRLSAKNDSADVDCLGSFETNCLLVAVLNCLIDCVRDPQRSAQLITGWAHGQKVLRNT